MLCFYDHLGVLFGVGIDFVGAGYEVRGQVVEDTQPSLHSVVEFSELGLHILRRFFKRFSQAFRVACTPEPSNAVSQLLDQEVERPLVRSGQGVHRVLVPCFQTLYLKQVVDHQVGFLRRLAYRNIQLAIQLTQPCHQVGISRHDWFRCFAPKVSINLQPFCLFLQPSTKTLPNIDV